MKPRGRWPVATRLGLLAAVVYLANARFDAAGDSVPMTLLPVAVARGDGPFLDRYRPLFAAMMRSAGMDPARDRPFFLAPARGRVLSAYPIGGLVLYAPLVAPQVWALDRVRPGWDADPARAFAAAVVMAKLASAAIAALAVALAVRLMERSGLGRAAGGAGVALAFGSPLWSIASQRAWQHGPAVLAMVAALLALAGPVGRVGLLAAGFWAAILAATRPIDAVFAAAIGLWVVRHHPRRLGWFLPGPLVIGAAFLGYNLHFFGRASGFQVYEPASGLRAAVEGVAGTLASPARGLLVFCPWAGLALAALPWSGRVIPRTSPVRWCLVALAPFGAALGAWVMWWGGHCYGPRFWTEAAPLLAVALAAGLEWARGRRALRWAFGAAIAWAVALQAIGATLYPSGWESDPSDVDLRAERLWDWRDSEVTRCLGLTGPRRQTSMRPNRATGR